MEGKKSFGSAKKRLEVLMSSCAAETMKPPTVVCIKHWLECSMVSMFSTELIIRNQLGAVKCFKSNYKAARGNIGSSFLQKETNIFLSWKTSHG